MSNLTPLYWEANGVSLHTRAWAIETKGGGRFTGPPKRGENIKVPFNPGSQWTPKVRDNNLLELPMWIGCWDQDGNEDVSMTKEARFHQNLNYLLSLMDVTGQFPLTKRFYQNGVVVVATAMAELLDPPDLAKTSAKDVYKATFQLELADPYFYGASINHAIGSSMTIIGEAPSTHVTIAKSGAGRVDFPDGQWIEYLGSGAVTIDCLNQTAIMGGDYVNGLIDRSRKFPRWPSVYPGTYTATGSGTLTYEPAYR